MVLCERYTGIDFGSLIERACVEANPRPTDLDFFPNPPVIVTLRFAVLKGAAIQGCDLCSFIHRGVLDKSNTRPVHEASKFEDLEHSTLLSCQLCLSAATEILH